jgi:two-component system response regulator
VEDNPNDAELAIHAFRKYHLTNRIRLLTDGEEALDFIFGRGAHQGREIGLSPKLILLDIKLPKVDGLEVLKEIKSDDRTKHIPVVMLTSSQEQRDVVQGYSQGANSYIVKPVDFGQLSEAIRALGLYWLTLNYPPEVR